MDQHVREYYRQASEGSPKGNFHRVIALHEAPDIDWMTLHDMVPALNKGWYELAQLPSKDRIDFICEFWLSKLPYRPDIDLSLNKFFSALDDIGIYVTQKTSQDYFEAHLVYSIKGDGGFFRGEPPITEENLQALKDFFSPYTLPEDYFLFLQIHDGFCKTTDCTGVTSSSLMPQSYHAFQNILSKYEPMQTKKGKIIDPKTLIPFYESFGMPFYQCFWADWYPENEMGNVYYSGETKTISDVETYGATSEILSFSTFVDWLMFYLERIV